MLITACAGSDTGFFEDTNSAGSTGTTASGTAYGTASGTATTPVTATATASIVHANQTERIATIRRGLSFKDGAFLIVKDAQGRQTAVLKALPKRVSGLRTAYVLEGEPFINNNVTLAGAAEAARLAKIYRDPEQ